MYNNLTNYFIIVLISSCALMVEDCSALSSRIVKGVKTVLKIPVDVVKAPIQLVNEAVLKPTLNGFRKCKNNCYLNQDIAEYYCKSHGLWENRLYIPDGSYCKCCKNVPLKDAERY